MRLKIPQAVGWFAAGIAVAVFVPTAVAGATAALTFTGIEGATGGTYANVTKAGQVEVAPAGASQMFVRTASGTTNGVPTTIGPPKGDALIITSIHVFGKLDGCTYLLYVDVRGIKETLSDTGCTPGVTVLPFDPGLPISSGSGLEVSGGVYVTVVGYTVPASAVPPGNV
jgi:hypothetical protein